ncbi:Transient receptor potential channel pyrexia [Fusarium albosuccineum]|uniref:Transient receptor potential channel pyrexia n=1 Tax=Fusarium albosuccineum TaxID=1237068 RepID=A0A8H4PGF4_9HYPO|nr:Transient receptor potential channel pyrexia [Fusarium albosuccineum]
MDGLSAAASIIAVIQLTAEATKYIIAASGAQKDRRRLREEIQACESALLQIYDCANDDEDDLNGGDENGVTRWKKKIEALEGSNAPLYRLAKTLDTVKTKLEPRQSRLSKATATLKWPFEEKEVTQLVEAIQRERSLLHFALAHKSAQLIQEIEQTSGENSRLLTDLISTVKAKSAENAVEVAKLNTILVDLQHTQNNIEDGFDRLQNRQMSLDDKAALDWITPIDYAPQQSDIYNRRQPGTGEWLIESDEFQDWLRADKQTLFCPGIPGAGKTMLTSIVVNYLLQVSYEDRTIGVAYIYCDFRRHNEQKGSDLIASLLKQLCQGRRALPEGVKTLFSKHQAPRTRPSLSELRRALQEVAAEYSRVLFVIDALDECETADGCLIHFLEHLFNLQAETKTNLFATSRFIPEIMQEFEKAMSLEIRATQHDVRRYLDDRMKRLPTFVQNRPELQEEVKARILESVQGMFLLAQLHLDSLVGKRSPKALRTALRNLSSGSDGSRAYDKAYDDAMERIQDQIADRVSLAKEALMWITCAKEQLSPLALQQALATEPGEPEFDEENISQIEDIVSACAGLVAIDAQSDTVRLVHFTTQGYFERTQNRWFPDASSQMTVKAITHLSFEPFPLEHASFYVFKRWLERSPFQVYAARNWGDHARESPGDFQTIEDFLTSEKRAMATEQKRNPLSLDYKTTGLHEAAYFGLKEAVERLLKKYPIDMQGPGGESALEIACQRGHLPLVELLIDCGASLSGTCVTNAVDQGYEAIVALLIDKGANINLPTFPSKPALQIAITQGSDSVVQLLLDHGADVNLQTSGRTSSLHCAVSRDSEPLVRLLLDHGAHTNLQDDDGASPLHTAVRHNYEPLVRLLLEHGADVNLLDDMGTSALALATKQGSDSMVQMLLDHGANVNLQDPYGVSILHFVVRRDNEPLTRLLLDHGANINLQAQNGMSPLHIAVRYDRQPLARLLLDRGAEVNLQDQDGMTPLYIAVCCSCQPLAQMLLDSGANIDVQDQDGLSPLHMAICCSCEPLVRLLVNRGADVNLKTKTGLTQLRSAIKEGSEQIVQVLLDRGAQIEELMEDGVLPSHETLPPDQRMQLLLDHGANLKLQDQHDISMLHSAVPDNNESTVLAFLGSGADLNSSDRRGTTALPIRTRQDDDSV